MFGIKHGDSDLSIKTLFTGHICNKSTDDIGFFFVSRIYKQNIDMYTTRKKVKNVNKLQRHNTCINKTKH